MKVCKKDGCENLIPKNFIDKNGKKHSFQRRSFCLECSPFGEHNTRNLNKTRRYIGDTNYGSGVCPYCGGISQTGNHKCFSCYFNERKKKISKKVHSIIGYDCWYCGYNKGELSQAILDFHHVDPKGKLFNLTTRELVGHAWNKVWEEMQKCVSLCCRCHREYHAKLISEKEILRIYKERWEEIKFNKEKQIIINERKKGKICPNCNVEHFKYTKYCSDRCAKISIRKVKDRPSKEQLLQEIKETNYCVVGRRYGVSDNAVRKWLK